MVSQQLRKVSRRSQQEHRMPGIFDLYTEPYDNWFNKNPHAYLTELLLLREEIPSGKRGIDIGVGTARFAQILDITYGIDLSASMLQIAKDRGCQVARADAGILPFRTGEFDYALLMATLCFVEHPVEVIKEAKRILNENGKLIIGIIDKKSKLGQSYLKKNSVFYNQAQFFSTEEVIQMLRKIGFYSIKTSQALFHDPYKMTEIGQFKEGHGQGGFVVVTGVK